MKITIDTTLPKIGNPFKSVGNILRGSAAIVKDDLANQKEDLKAGLHRIETRGQLEHRASLIKKLEKLQKQIG